MEGSLEQIEWNELELLHAPSHTDIVPGIVDSQLEWVALHQIRDASPGNLPITELRSSHPRQ